MREGKGEMAEMRVAVVADTTGAAGEVARGLRGWGYAVRAFPLRKGGAYERVRELRPGVVVVRTSGRSFSLVSAFARAAEREGHALVLLTPSGSRQAMKLAVETGAFVHLVEPVAAQALAAGVRVAAGRAGDVLRLRRRVAEAREWIEARKVVDRAKGVLMSRFGLSEEDAHRMLQRESRNRNRRLIETAWHVVRAEAQLSSRARPTRLAPPGGG